MKNFRAPAVPLVTVDPYFSIWSFDDNLYDNPTKHWTGACHSLTGIIYIDNAAYCFMGKTSFPPIIQKSVEIRPMTTNYIFENDAAELSVSFMTPLFLDDLYVMSRPFSYIYYSIKSKGEHDISVEFSASAECSAKINMQKIQKGMTDYSIFCGAKLQRILNKSGDNVTIDWGYLHLIAPKGELYFGKNNLSLNAKVTEREGFICLAYDDVKSIEYFGRHLQSYCYKDGATFDDIAGLAVAEFHKLKERADLFDKKLMGDALEFGEKYADIISLAYRQAIAAHKLVYDGENALFMSKECFSNGCMATVDVTYPSIPLFLHCNTELVKAMLRPIFEFARSDDWEYSFAPHDVGQYPLANGQAYNPNTIEGQMPVEECGNILLCVAAVCAIDGNTGFAEENKDLLEQYAKYLLDKGFDPENQLCTDDFAGHLAHNTNLSVKAILGIAAWGALNNNAEYLNAAREFAKAWKEKAREEYHYKLTFDSESTWSLKYNMVWDKLLKLNVFDEDIFVDEVKYYMTELNKYGVPLDSRSDYTKTDWLVWSTVLDNNPQYRDKVFEAIWNMLCDTESRVPFTDWYYTSTAKQVGFQNRTVLGGVFINLLQADF